MVWADLDHDIADGDTLKEQCWDACQKAGISRDQFDTVVFAFAKDRLENWIEYLMTGATDEAKEGPRVSPADAADAAVRLATRCKSGSVEPPLPESLEWSCRNWRRLVARMQD
jgi:hypothetical protein